MGNISYMAYRVGSHMPIYEAQFSAPVQAGGLTRGMSTLARYR